MNRETSFQRENLLPKFVCNVGEIPFLSVINHHAQTVWVTIGSWNQTKRNRVRDLIAVIIMPQCYTDTQQWLVQFTCNMNWCPHEAVVIEETGSPLSQQHLHTASEAFLSSQVEHRASRGVLHVHVGCRLRQHTQRLPVSFISLRKQRGTSQRLWIYLEWWLVSTCRVCEMLWNSRRDAEDWRGYCFLCLQVH